MTKRKELRDLARHRVEACWPGFRQPEDYGYDFRDLVSPYSRTAGNLDADVMIVLQDWSSHDKLSGPHNEDVARLGHDPQLRTNKRLRRLLCLHLGLRLEDTYGTNLFPFIKPGSISSRIPTADLVRAAEQFTMPQIRIVRPRVVLALGRRTADALERVGANVIALPHPAARFSDETMDRHWAESLSTATRAEDLSAQMLTPDHPLFRLQGRGRSGGGPPSARDKYGLRS